MIKTEQVVSWAKKRYGLEGVVTTFPGYDEQNFLLKDKSENWYVVKITDDLSRLPFLKAQAAMIKQLVSKEGRSFFPEHVVNQQQEEITEIDFPTFQKGYMRVVKFLPGTFLAEGIPHSSKLMKDFGQFLGKMDKHLVQFDHIGAHRKYDWDIQHALDWQKVIPLVKDHEKRRLAAYFLLQFEENVLPVQADLRHAVIHNDANDWNVLAHGDYITGIIDFGDVVYAPLVNNLAIALTYIMLETEKPFEKAYAVVEGYHQVYPLTETEVDLLYYLIAARLCVSVLHAAQQRAAESTNPHHFLTEKPAWKLLNYFLETNPLRVQQLFRKACKLPLIYQEEENYSALLEERNQYIGRNLSISYQKNLKIVRGALQYLYDDKGNTFLDCVNNVSHVGHCHPTVVKAMQKQIATLNTNTRYLHDGLEEYAKLICSTLPEPLGVCYFVNSGSEANDLAVRMARNYTQQHDVIVLDHAYHGTSTLDIDMSPYKFDGKGGFPQPDFIHKAESPNAYRGRFRYDDALAGEKYAQSVQEIIQELAKKNKKPAAFIAESLLGVGGQVPLPPKYLQTVYAYMHKVGGVVIADEVQVGFGRVGSCFWGFELQEVVPDIVVMGKPIGNGHPLAAVVVKPEIAEAFNNGMEYFNTFGGNPVSMATGKAVFTVIKEEELQKNALEVGTYLRDRLAKMAEKYAFIDDVRGEGLFVGAEFVKDTETLTPEVTLLNEVVERMRDRGFLLSTDGPLHNVLKIKPPIVFSKKNADDLVLNLTEVLDQIIA